MTRSIVIGDVHGCADELSALVDRLAVTADDRVYFVGDLVRELGARSVRGNHEHRLLTGARTGSLEIDTMTDHTRSQLDDADWATLEAMPLWLDVPGHDLRIVHAGVMPDVPIEAQLDHHLLHLRGLADDGSPVLRRADGTLWGERYTGPPHVVFGHHALMDPQVHHWATGIDTACVYGGALTALVLHEGQAVPAVADRHSVLVHEPARRVYAAN